MKSLVAAGAETAGAEEDVVAEEALRAELEQLYAVQKELLSAAGLGRPATEVATEEEAGDSREIAQLRAENASLRGRVEELEAQVQAAIQGRDSAWAEHQGEYEQLLEEKSEVIRSLHLQIQELQQAGEKGGPVPPAADLGHALVHQQELQALRERLDQDRAQLEADEQAIEDQMRQMELTLSRERVELARQRTELQRLQTDFQHELEMAARDEKLRERLLPLQRRNQEVASAKGGGSGPPRPASTAQLPRPGTMLQLGAAGASEPIQVPKRPASGLLRRLFGKGG
jgi:hypothetical protein